MSLNPGPNSQGLEYSPQSVSIQSHALSCLGEVG